MSISLAPHLRGEGWGERLLSPNSTERLRKLPLTRIASNDAIRPSPQAGRGEICPPPSTKPPQRHRSWAVPPLILPAPPDETAELLPDRFRRWFAGRGWSPREHQLALLAKARDDRSALLIAPTGAGKTLAGFLPTLVELSAASPFARSAPLPPGAARAGGGETTAYAAKSSRPEFISTGRGVRRSRGLHTLYISPLKALAVDIARNLETPVSEMGLAVKVETRTGDTPVSRRPRQPRYPPGPPLTTPGPLAPVLSSDDAPLLFSSLRRIVLHELHPLPTSKRGDLLSLAPARLWRLSPPTPPLPS